MILENWEASLPLFIKVMPVEYQQALERQRQAVDNSVVTVSASEEVFAERHGEKNRCFNPKSPHSPTEAAAVR